MERDFRDSAREFGYEPWTCFTFFEWCVASRMVKKSTIQLMRERLFDPSKAHPEWFISFAKTIEVIGFEECASAENLHSFVTTSPHHRRNFHWRREFKRRLGLMLDHYDSENKHRTAKRMQLLRHDRQWLGANVMQRPAPERGGMISPVSKTPNESQSV
jgi:hypothetical protein